MPYQFSQSSLTKLAQVDHRMVQVVKLALRLSKHDFGIECGIRDLATQKVRLDSGASTTMNSRHLPNENGESEAVDIKVYVDGQITWDTKYYRKVAGAMFKAAFILQIPIEWGGHWQSIYDAGHFQLSREV